MAKSMTMDRNLALEVVRVTEAAALSAATLMGRGDEKAADQAAVDAMRRALNSLAIEGTVVIGEGERDEAPMLFIGEKVGSGGPKVDIALDPLEGTTITAKGGHNALAVVAMAAEGGFLNAPDVYMEKIAVGVGLPEGVIDLDAKPEQNLRRAGQGQEGRGLRYRRLHPRPPAPCRADRARALGRRPHHADLRRRRQRRHRHVAAGQRRRHLSRQRRRPEGVLAAAALRCIGGQMQGRLLFRNDDERARAKKWGVTDLNRKYGMLDMAKGDVMFARHRRHRRRHAAGRAALRARRHDPFDGHALQDRHRAHHRGAAQFRAQGLGESVKGRRR